MGVRVAVAPTVEPITLDTARKHLGVEPYEIDSSGTGSHPHDTMIMAMVGAAREYAEAFTGLSIAQKTYELALDAFPDDADIELPHPPLIEVSSVTYVTKDSSDAFVTETITTDSYTVDTQASVEANVPARAWLSPAYGTSWPTPSAVINAVKVRYVAGYQVPEPDSSSPDAESLPNAIRAAILLMLGHLYENREAVASKQVYEVPMAVESLLRTFRVRLGMA